MMTNEQLKDWARSTLRKYGEDGNPIEANV